MENQTPYYLFFDYDGTVCIEGSVPEENVRAMRTAQSMGHKLILNTGRAYGGYLTRLAIDSHIPWDYMIFAGADIRQGERVLYRQLIPADRFWEWVQYAHRHQYRIVYGGEKELWSFDFENHPSSFDKILKLQAENPQTKILIHARMDRSDMPQDDLTVIQMKTYADIFPAGCDKGSAIKRLCELTGASLSQCVCFGDSENDIDMFRVCPTGVCMKDSPKALSDLATYQTTEKYGVAEGLRWLLEQKSEKQP